MTANILDTAGREAEIARLNGALKATTLALSKAREAADRNNQAHQDAFQILADNYDALASEYKCAMQRGAELETKCADLSKRLDNSQCTVGELMRQRNEARSEVEHMYSVSRDQEATIAKLDRASNALAHVYHMPEHATDKTGRMQIAETLNSVGFSLVY